MSNIENLGRYGEFTQAAKAAGGVDNYLGQVKTGARAEGAVIGIVVAAAGAWVVGKIRQRAARAEERLRTTVQEFGDGEHEYGLDDLQDPR